MKDVFRLIREGSKSLAAHPLFTTWLESDAVAARAKLAFCPAAIDFVMGFRDFNTYFVHYPAPRDALEEAMNVHAAEDATHAALFLEDWALLGFDEQLGWAPRDLYWWITCEHTEASRRLDFELMSLVFHNPDPLLRFALVETMEAAGNVFFTRTVPIAEALAGELGRDLPYFGKYHLDRETGHLQGADERVFFRAPMTDAQRTAACALVVRVFAIFAAHFTAWERHARAVHEGRWSFSAPEDAARHAALRADRPVDVTAAMSLQHPPEAAGMAGELKSLLAASFEKLWQTPFYSWVRESGPGEFGRVMRAFFLQWVVDNWTCADWFAFDTTYPTPATPLERGINRLSVLYASEMNRRYQEWEQLGFDELLGWKSAAALRHYWLDERVDLHRAVFADLRKLTFRHPEPLYRYWIMKSFVRFGDTLMHSVGALMRGSGVDDESFVGFAGQPERLHPDLPPDPEADAAVLALESAPLTREQMLTIRQIVTETAEHEERRSAISWAVVQERRFAHLEERWNERSRSMHEVKVSEVVASSAQAVWSILEDFGGAARWAGAGLESCTVEGTGVGAVRHMVGGGLSIAERLESHDPEALSLSYAIVGPSPLPMKDYVSSIRVVPEGPGRCRVEWTGRFEPHGAPAEVAEGIVRKVYGDGIEGLRRALAL